MTGLNDVRALERTRMSAMVKGEFDSISRYLDDDLIYIHSNGMTDSKTSYLRSLNQGRYVYESIEVFEERHAEDPNFIVLTQTLEVRIRTDAGPAQARQVLATSAWRRRAGEWKLIVMQATPLLAAAPEYAQAGNTDRGMRAGLFIDTE